MTNEITETRLWNFPIRAEDVPEAGRHFSISADAATRAAIAANIGLRSLEQLEATFEVVRRARNGLNVVGEVNAVVGQFCVVSLEPIDSVIIEKVDVDYVSASPQDFAGGPARVQAGEESEDDPPEPLVDGTIDLAALAIEFLILGVDPYPRKPGAEFVAPRVEVEDGSPFAALARLKQGSNKGK